MHEQRHEVGCSEKLLTHVSELWEEKPELIPEPEGSSKSFAESLGAEGRQCQKSGEEEERERGKICGFLSSPWAGLCVTSNSSLAERAEEDRSSLATHTVVSSGLDLNIFRFCGLLQNVGRMNTKL